MTTTDPKLIERIARAMCKHDGLDAEELVCLGMHSVPRWETREFAGRATAILPIVAAAINEAVQNAGQWQDIATAPRDGSVILAYRPDAGVFTAHYVEEDAHLSNAMNPPEGDCYWFTTGGEDLTEDMPTHWMPLPSPPAIEAHKESGHG